MIDKFTLKMRQAMPLDDKIKFTQRRIHEWVKEFGVNGCYVSFSGGKDSTVLLDIVRGLYPDIEAVFVDTGLEYPEIRQFVKTFDNIKMRKHLEDSKHYKYRFDKLNGDKGSYSCPQWKFLLKAPFKISNKCCNVMKKKPAHNYHKQTGKVPFIGTMAEESRLREQKYLQNGCNGFKNKIPTSTPMAFWTEQDVLQYIYENKLPIASVYGDVIKNDKYYTTGCQRTGCMFCGFGCHLEKYPNRFQRLAETHPKQYDYIINKLGMGEVLDYIGVEYRPNIDKGQLKIL